jgi:hypothetical protein
MIVIISWLDVRQNEANNRENCDGIVFGSREKTFREKLKLNACGKKLDERGKLQIHVLCLLYSRVSSSS